MQRRAATVLLLIVLTACASLPAMVADRLFCGRGIPGGGMVSDEQWETFVREVVTPRFPDGLTMWRAEGQWKGDDGVLVREPVMVIEIVHPHDPAIDRRVDEIANEYRSRFRQDAVMRVTVPARMTFVR